MEGACRQETSLTFASTARRPLEAPTTSADTSSSTLVTPQLTQLTNKRMYSVKVNGASYKRRPKKIPLADKPFCVPISRGETFPVQPVQHEFHPEVPPAATREDPQW